MKVQTDNSHLDEKVFLRLESLPKKEVVRVLECFAGDGVIWKAVKQQTKQPIRILRIDEKTDKKGIYLKGNNLKFMMSMDLAAFDIIDLDAYGSPFKQLEILFQQRYKGIVHVTNCKQGNARIHYALLKELGYTESMIKKCPSLFEKKQNDTIFKWLYRRGVKKVKGFFFTDSFGTKRYFWFKMK